jgi:hypothetical protein
MAGSNFVLISATGQLDVVSYDDLHPAFGHGSTEAVAKAHAVIWVSDEGAVWFKRPLDLLVSAES